MLISRLIADRNDLLTRIEEVKHTLEAEGLPITASAEDFGGGVIVEIQTFAETALVLADALDAHFPGCDRLIASGEIKIPKLFVSDMDSTMIQQECIDELADYAGLKDRVADITERAMQGEIDFADALHERVGLLKGLDEAVIATCLEQRIDMMPGARTLVQTLRAKGCRTVLVTGGFHHFADPIATQLGFEKVVGNQLDVDDNKLTGGLAGPIVDSAVKRKLLEDEQGAMRAGSPSLATGDGANDIPMLKAANYGFAYHAKPAARDAANGRVDHGDLTTVLRLLGIPEGEWAK